MAAIKIACAKCGQRVSGDDSFLGTTVQCPICSSDIKFPEKPVDGGGSGDLASLPTAFGQSGGIPEAPRPQGPPPGAEQPPQPQPYQRSAPHQQAQPYQPQPQPEAPAPQQQQQQSYPQQSYPQQYAYPQQLPGGQLLQPGLPAQPGLPMGPPQGLYGAPPQQQGSHAQHPQQRSDSADREDAGIMPWATLITGVLALLSCSGVILGPAAIILGHLTLIRIDNDDKSARMKTTIGLILGYVSLVLMVIVLVGLKLGGVIGAGEPVE